jgi:ubiquitin conjugation factor E4 B
MGIWGYGRERNGILGGLLNSHPVALKHLMPALMHFYVGQWSVSLDGPYGR